MSMFTCHTVKITLPSPSSTLRLFPFGDIHSDAPGFDEERFRRYFARVCAADPKATVALGLGDEVDMASFTERRGLANAGLHESTARTLDTAAWRRLNRLHHVLRGFRGTWAGLIEGNHHWAWLDKRGQPEKGIKFGETSTDWLAARLGTQNRGYLSYIRLQVSLGPNTNKRVKFDIVACHGKAGGKLIGTSINQIDDLRRIFPEADVYLMGHNHQRGGLPDTSLYLSNERGRPVLKQRRQFLVRTGGFLKQYVPGEEGYAAGRLYKPTDLGGVEFQIQWHLKDGLLMPDTVLLT